MEITIYDRRFTRYNGNEYRLVISGKSEALRTTDQSKFDESFISYGNFYLDDGQPLAVYLLEEGNGYDIFTSPVKVNGKETNLRFSWNYNSGEIDLLGIWDGIEKSGICSRGGEKLNAGDVIVPLYNAFNIDTDKEYQFKGDNYTFSGRSRIHFDYLPDGGYLYGFILEDIFSNTYATDVVYFEIADDEISYSNIE